MNMLLVWPGALVLPTYLAEKENKLSNTRGSLDIVYKSIEIESQSCHPRSGLSNLNFSKTNNTTSIANMAVNNLANAMKTQQHMSINTLGSTD